MKKYKIFYHYTEILDDPIEAENEEDAKDCFYEMMQSDGEGHHYPHKTEIRAEEIICQ